MREPQLFGIRRTGELTAEISDGAADAGVLDPLPPGSAAAADGISMDREIPWALPANASPEMRFHRLVVVQRAIWSLLKEHNGLHDRDLFARIGELDAEDGNVDGRYTPRARCDACGAVSAAGARCTFCNESVGEPDPFSGL